ncbi:MAG: hypothetical protein WBL74_06690 [Novosphingobium sp.]|uniref:hypothetical protein n=1 Tax=Novosphingobium sp. TaxID=1874826 RepID=UPI003C7BF307
MGRRSANIVAAIATALWFAIFAMGRDLSYSVYEQGPGIFPSSGQLDGYMVAPLVVAFGIAIAAWCFNAAQRWYWLLGTLAAVTLVSIIPYMLGYSGGV